MITKDYLEDFNSPLRKITGKAELITSSAETKSGKYVELDNPDASKPITAKLSSKNLIDMNDWVEKKVADKTEDGSYYTSCARMYNTYGPDSGSGLYIPTDGNNRITVSGSVKTTASNVSSYCFIVMIYYTDGTSTRINWTGKFTNGVSDWQTVTKTSDANKTIEKVCTSWNTIPVYVKDFQIELGTTATPYTPYLTTSSLGDNLFGNNSLQDYFGDREDLYNFEVREEPYIVEYVEGKYDNTEYSIGFGENENTGEHYFVSEIASTDLSFIPKVGDKFKCVDKDGMLYLYLYNENTVEIMVSGKNLFDEETKFTSLGFKKQEDGTWLANNYHGRVFTPPIGSNQMFFRATAKSTKAHTSPPFTIRVYYTDGTYSTPFTLDNNQTDWVELQGSTNASKIISSISFSFGGSVVTNESYYIKELMFSYVDSAYEPYNKEPTYYTATIDEEIEVEPYIPTTVIVPSTGAYIEKASYIKEIVNTFSHTDALQSITIDRIGEKNKFFGFIVSQKATINLLDRNRELEISNGNCFKTYFNINENNFVDNFPRFFVSEAKRNETTNALTITANDVFSAAAGIPVSELGLESYTIRQFAEACAARLDLKLVIRDVEDETIFDTQYDEGANFEGTESLRDAIKAIAEATQTICYASPDSLVFRRLKAAAADLNIEKKHYFNLTNKGVKTLANICHATELGDNISTTSTLGGETQYVRDNPFWELKENIADTVDNALDTIGGVSFNAFECKWRGNFLAEIGDRLDITTKDDNIITSYLLDDTITYKGGYSQKSSWVYESGKEETPSNPSTLGEVIKQTFAKVDKANKQIDMVVSESSANKEAIAALQFNTNSINASVTQLEKDFKENKDTTADDIATLKSKVDLQITPEDVSIAIQKEMSNGVDKVETTTGYKFGDEGLDITKSNSEVSTKITHEGMTVAAAGNPVLTANHEGVEAVDLHATTYLIIGNYSRFEDYDGRTGCFWIGGNS